MKNEEENMNKYTKNSDVKVLYLGTPEMSAHVLEAIIEAGFTVVGVVAQEDKEVGRHHEMQSAPTKIVAEKHNIRVFTPHKIRLDYSFATKLDFDCIVCLAYGQLIPDGLLSLAKVGNINLHGSILPSYRGAAPIQRAIMDDLSTTGVSLMEMVSAMDAGKVYDVAKVSILPNDTYTLLCSKIAEAGATLIVKDLLSYANGTLEGHEQNEKEVTFANKIKPEDEHLPLIKNCEMTIAYIRALSETPGAYVELGDKKLKIYHASLYSHDVLRAVGEIIPNKKHFLIQLYDGVIELLVVQIEGKGKMDGASFLSGARLGDHAFVK